MTDVGLSPRLAYDRVMYTAPEVFWHRLTRVVPEKGP